MNFYSGTLNIVLKLLKGLGSFVGNSKVSPASRRYIFDTRLFYTLKFFEIDQFRIQFTYLFICKIMTRIKSVLKNVMRKLFNFVMRVDIEALAKTILPLSFIVWGEFL